ncbi:MAG: hypothetical protein HRU76_04465 [Phycisphaeraceae bacterium]|nr:hypothetical protein [Phycisphaerales bacterium]QOJ16886.1 MAG: hypothetical protein HRU76_04465 [Phycisphaeraceae bacterium]
MKPSTMRIDAGKAVLWASAFILGALVILQAGRLPGNPAYAGEVSSRANYTIVAADSGRGGDVKPDEVIYVIDNVNGLIILYGADARTGTVAPLDGGPLPYLFFNALKR